MPPTHNLLFFPCTKTASCLCQGLYEPGRLEGFFLFSTLRNILLFPHTPFLILGGPPGWEQLCQCSFSSPLSSILFSLSLFPFTVLFLSSDKAQLHLSSPWTKEGGIWDTVYAWPLGTRWGGILCFSVFYFFSFSIFWQRLGIDERPQAASPRDGEERQGYKVMHLYLSVGLGQSHPFS